MDQGSYIETRVERALMKGFPYIAIDPRCISENPEARDLAGNEYCAQETQETMIISRGCIDKCSKCLVEVPYEIASKLFLDPVSGKIICDFLIIWEGSGEGLYIGRNVEAHVIEATGHNIYSIVSEGDHVRSRSKIAYITTGKGEVRTLRAGVDGIIVYISQELTSKPEKLLFVVVGGDNVRRARIF
jgi:hypothetical protein